MRLFHTYPSPAIFLVLAAACELPAQLGELPSGSAGEDQGGSSEGASASSSGGSSEGDEPTGGVALCADSEAPSEWAQTRGPADVPALFRELATGPNGEIVAVGVDGDDTDVFVKMFDPAGALLWTQTYGGVHGLFDWAIGVAVDDAGFVHVALTETVFEGKVGEVYVSVDARIVVLRYAPDGTLAWRWEHERPPAGMNESYYPDGAIGLVGDRLVILEHSPDDPVFRIELDAQGSALDEVELAMPAGMTDERLAMGADGSAYVAGKLADTQWIGGFRPDGELEWSDQFGGADDVSKLLLADGAGGVYFSWSTGAVESAEHQLRRYGPAGAALWTVTLPMTHPEASGATAGVIRCDGSLMLSGSRDMPSGPDIMGFGRRDLWIAHYTADGAALWTFEHEFGPPFSSGAGSAITATLEGAPVVAGHFVGEEGIGVPWFEWLGG
jgi:hypothetical protein